MNKLTIHDGGDTSVGIMPQYWELDLPYNDEDVTEEEEMRFIDSVKQLYQDYCEGRMQIWKDSKLLVQNHWIEMQQIDDEPENEKEQS